MTLESMRKARRALMVAAKEPIESLRNSLSSLSALISAHHSPLLRADLHTQHFLSLHHSSLSVTKEKRLGHAERLAEKAKEYRERREMVEFLERYEGQKKVEALLQSNEAVMKQCADRAKACEEAEAAQVETQATEESAKEYEGKLRCLCEVTGASEPAGIVEYWNYLKDSCTDMEQWIQSAHKKLSRLKLSERELRSELSLMRSSVSVPPLSALRTQVTTSTKALSSCFSSVLATQSRHWTITLHTITYSLQLLAERLSPGVSYQDASAEEAIQSVLSSLTAMQQC